MTVRYFAAARASAGVGTEVLEGDTVAAVIDQARTRHPGLDRVLAVASLMLDGTRVTATDSRTVVAPATLDILPPFAGG